MIITKGGFNKVDYFSLNQLLWDKLVKLNKSLGKEYDICVHCGIEGKHSATGFHPKGMAVDCHFEVGGKLVMPDKVVYDILKHWEGGLGVYDFWNNPGFHLDIGPVRQWCKNRPDEPALAFGIYITSLRSE